MTSEQFTHWLQSFSESNDTPPTAKQWESIRNHLAKVSVQHTPRWSDQPVFHQIRIIGPILQTAAPSPHPPYMLWSGDI